MSLWGMHFIQRFYVKSNTGVNDNEFCHNGKKKNNLLKIGWGDSLVESSVSVRQQQRDFNYDFLSRVAYS